MSSVMLGPFERHATRNVLQMSNENATDTFSAIYKRIGEDPTDMWHQILGKGTTAVATWLKSDKKKVLKITADDSDAYAMAKFLKRPSRHVVKVYDVFQITPYSFGIVAQKVTPLPRSEYKDWTKTRNALSKVIGVPALGSGDTPDYQQKLDEYYEYTSKSQVEPVKAMKAFLKQLGVFDNKLADRGIQGFQDYHAGNVGMNGRDLVLLDLGGIRTSVPSLPQLNIKMV